MVMITTVEIGHKPHGVPEDFENNFKAACQVGNLDAVIAMMETAQSFPPGSPISEPEETPAHVRVEVRSWWDDQLSRGLLKAVVEGHRPVVAHLLDHGVGLMDYAFAECVRLGHTHVFEEFLDHGFDINSIEKGGQHALMHSTKNIPMMQWLLDRGADPNVTNYMGVLPISWAVYGEMNPGPAMLLAHGAALPPNILTTAIPASDRPGKSGGTDMVRFLIDNGAELNHINRVRRHSGTPIYFAASQGYLDIVQLLLDAGADATIRCHDETPADVARQEGHMDVYELLVKATDPSAAHGPSLA